MQPYLTNNIVCGFWVCSMVIFFFSCRWFYCVVLHVHFDVNHEPLVEMQRNVVLVEMAVVVVVIY